MLKGDILNKTEITKQKKNLIKAENKLLTQEMLKLNW